MTAVHQVLLLVATVFVLSQSLPHPGGPLVLAPPPYEQSIESLCRVICARPDVLCPAECSLARFDPFIKRSARVNRARKFSGYGSDSGVDSFDDYLFMKLMGRNLGDRD